MENFVLINMPISTGTVVINNNARDILMKFSSWKILASLNTIGVIIVNINGMLINDKQAVIEVKETDKATFPFTNLDK